MNTIAPFTSEGYYHIYNQTSGKEILFKSDKNRKYILKRFHFYLKPFLYIHSYALMSNHFHFSVQVKEKNKILNYLSKVEIGDRTKIMKEFLESKTSEVSETSDVCPENLLNRLIIHQWQRFFVSYTKAFNKSHNRTGNLFRQKFKRSAFDPELKLQYLQYYIHRNARKHEVVHNFLDYKHTSYHEIINEEDWLIDIPKSLEW